jgi:hypothetical protein
MGAREAGRAAGTAKQPSGSQENGRDEEDGRGGTTASPELNDPKWIASPLSLCDPYTGALAQVMTDNPLYDLLRESFFRGQKVQVGVRDFGQNPQSGSPKICVDRVSLLR